MKKILVILSFALLLTACGKDKVDLNIVTVNWNSMTFEAPENWVIQQVNSKFLKVGHGVGYMEITRGADLSAFDLYEEMNVADQNYKFIDGVETDIYTTSWEKTDILIKTTLEPKIAVKIFETLRKPRIEWEGYEFERPGGLDWYTTVQTIGFAEDDGDFLENETYPPCEYARMEDEVCDTELFLTITLYEEAADEDVYSEISFFDEVDFNGSKYQVIRYLNLDTASERVLYVAFLPRGKFAWIDADKSRDDDAQDILNELIKL